MSTELSLEVNQWALERWIEAATWPLLTVALGVEIAALAGGDE